MVYPRCWPSVGVDGVSTLCVRTARGTSPGSQGTTDAMKPVSQRKRASTLAGSGRKTQHNMRFVEQAPYAGVRHERTICEVYQRDPWCTGDSSCSSEVGCVRFGSRLWRY